MNWANALNVIYVLIVLLISLYGLHALVITTLFLLHRKKDIQPGKEPEEWPRVAVQIPLYNERYVVEKMIETVCAFDYPKDKLIIQILDDSTDQTTEVARQCVEYYRSQGFQIELRHRQDRSGYKAGALAQAGFNSSVDFYAIFDADFVPPASFLKKVIPYFESAPNVGLVQTRWGHLNREANVITRTQALFLDGHQVVEQVARSRSNLLLNFNGTCGVWRSECIRDSGGWESDTVSEDIDISYRAQMNGWKIVFLPNLIVPGEVPPTLSIFKQQQYRWTFGHIQVFKKLILAILTSRKLTVSQRIGALFHLSTNFVQAAALLMFLLTVPLALLHPRLPSSLGLISLASCGPTVLFAVSQIFGYHDGPVKALYRLLHLPLLVLVAIGMTASNVSAIFGALAGRHLVWKVTPKSNHPRRTTRQQAVPAMVWVEIALSIYCAVGLSLSFRGSPELIPLSILGMLSFGYVGCSGLVESNHPKKTSPVKVEMAHD